MNDSPICFNGSNKPVMARTGEFYSQMAPELNLQIAARLFNGKDEFNQIMEMIYLNHMLQSTDIYKKNSLINETVSSKLLNEFLKMDAGFMIPWKTKYRLIPEMPRGGSALSRKTSAVPDHVVR